MDHFLKRRYKQYTFGKWSLLIIPLCLCFFILFTGFILKGDKEGTFAGYILLNILKQIPLIGEYCSSFFIIPDEAFYLLPYLNHCFLLPMLMMFLIRDHIREWLPDQKFLTLSTIGLFLYALIIDPPMGIPPEVEVPHIKGPWFFIGIQSLLRILPPLWAGLVLPGLFIGLLLILPLLKGAWTRITHNLIVASCFFYLVISIGEYANLF